MSSIGWRNSDRPPLQTGLTAILAGPIGIHDPQVYLGLGAFCQVLAFLAVASLWRRGQIGLNAALVSQGLIAFSGIMFFYTVFTWPKLMAAAFVIVAVSALDRLSGSADRDPKSVRADVAILMLALVFAMLSHGAAVFSLIGFAMVYGIRALRNRRALALVVGLGLSVMLYLPWMAHQKLVDPPANRLVKMHLAGQIPLEELDDSVGAWTEIKHAYGRLSASQILEHKRLNMLRLAGYDEIDLAKDIAWKGILGGTCAWDRVPHGLALQSYLFDPEDFGCDWWTLTTLRRVEQRDLLLPAVVVPLTFASAAFGVLLWRRRRGHAVPQGAAEGGDKGFEIRIAIGQGLGVLIWCLIMFGPGETRLTHASMALVVLLLAQLAAVMARAPWWLGTACLALMGADFAVTWVVSLPECGKAPCILIPDSDSPTLLLLGCLSLLLVAGRGISALKSASSASDFNTDFTSSGDR
jgi:hypothetical protein